jgi:hypothetical protein
MAEKIELVNNTVNLTEFNQVVDTSFKYFTRAVEQQDPDTVEELFRLYRKLFFNIPPTGTNSHETLVLESLKVYTLDLSSETAPLQAEIADLRQRLLEANEQIQELSQQITIVSNVPATI